MTRLGLALVVILLTATSCSGDGSERFEFDNDNASVDVDTAQLREAKADAGVEPCSPGPAPSGEVEDGLPQVTLPCLGGGPAVDLTTLRGPLVVNLWANYCGPCRTELPHYQRLHEAAGGKVAVLGVDYLDPQPGQALALVKETGVTFPLLADPDGDLRAPLRVRALPGVAFLDGEGTIAHIEYVEIKSYGQLRDMVEEHLGVRL